MPYHVKIRKKNPAGKPGACFGTFGPFTTQAKAKQQAQILADDAAPGVVVTVEPVRRTANKRKRKRNTTSRPASTAAVVSNPRHRVHKGHSIKGSRGNYVVEAYDKAFTTLKKAKAWIDHHVAAELRRLNPKKKNPRVARQPAASRAKAKKLTKSKTFAGKRYMLKRAYASKVQATARASKLRKEGFRARVVSLGGKHGVYCRKAK